MTARKRLKNVKKGESCVYLWIHDFLTARGFAQNMAGHIAGAAMVLYIALVSLFAYCIAKLVVKKLISAFADKRKTGWSEAFFAHAVFDRIALLVPALVANALAPTFPSGEEWISRIAQCLIMIGFLRALDRFLDAVDELYKRREIARTRPIKGYLQVVKIVSYTVGAVIMISVLMDRSPLILLGGLGAATAVILLIFQNTILGFVASIQLTENDMVRIGDWIEMSAHAANGTVIEISLHTVKVRNFDNSITTVPTYALISESFKNWRAMQDTGARRMQRAVNIDMTTVGAFDAEIFARTQDLCGVKEYARENDANSGRTNLGAFCAHMRAYLSEHPRVNQNMACMARVLAPDEHGIPVEIYAFADTVVWQVFEGIQAEIVEYMLCALPKFGLRVFQSPSGQDVAAMR